jgi:spoIIIJ-associated protein
MDQAEASGKTVEDALRKALAQLGATRDEVEFVVLDEGQKGGLFGRGARDAMVRVERTGNSQPASRGPATGDTRIPRGRQPQGGRSGTGQRPPRAPRPASGRSERPSGRTGYEQAAPKLTAEDFVRPRGQEPAEPAAAEAPRPRGRGARSTPSEAPAGPPRERAPRGERRSRDEEPHVDPDINAEEVDFAAHVVDDLLRILEIDCELTIREPLTPGDGLGAVRAVIDISGEDLGLLIGRRGDTLLSLQYLVNLIVGRRFPGNGGVTLDVEHYRHRREEQVVSLAQRMAARVRETGSPITLEPMSAAERRLVHITLADDPELETNSTGEGDNRKVVISARR